MGRANVYLPDDLERRVKAARIPISEVCQHVNVENGIMVQAQQGLLAIGSGVHLFGRSLVRELRRGWRGRRLVRPGCVPRRGAGASPRCPRRCCCTRGVRVGVVAPPVGFPADGTGTVVATVARPARRAESGRNGLGR